MSSWVAIYRLAFDVCEGGICNHVPTWPYSDWLDKALSIKIYIRTHLSQTLVALLATGMGFIKQWAGRSCLSLLLLLSNIMQSSVFPSEVDYKLNMKIPNCHCVCPCEENVSVLVGLLLSIENTNIYSELMFDHIWHSLCSQLLLLQCIIIQCLSLID